jgi:hypothetical protein
MDFTQTSATRVEPILNTILVGAPFRSFDRLFGSAAGFSVVAGEVVSYDDTANQWRPYNAVDSHAGVVLEAATLGAAETATLPVLQSGAVKLSELTNAPAAWEVGMTAGLLILC